MEDPVADDVEAEVAGLDYAGVDRADRDLVGVVAAHGDGPVRKVEVVVDEWSQRLVPIEADAVQVVCLALVPARSGGDVDDCRRDAVIGARRDEPDVTVFIEEGGVDDGSVGGRV